MSNRPNRSFSVSVAYRLRGTDNLRFFSCVVRAPRERDALTMAERRCKASIGRARCDVLDSEARPTPRVALLGGC